MLLLLWLLSVASVQGLLQKEYLTEEMVPDPGPDLDTVYVPGTAGAAWTGEEIRSTRYRILQAIHPDWAVKEEMYGRAASRVGATENTIMRLVFHDCVRYTDGTGGCDGCLNWSGVGVEHPKVFDETKYYTYDTVNQTDNNGLADIVEKLELIYTTLDWPFKEASLTGSLQQLGKSRADLWQFAGLVALERALERANRACDLDKWSRQQVSLLESREACEFKLRAPLKFKSGRADCVPEDGGRGFVTSKAETQPLLLGDAKHTTDFFLAEFGMSAEHSQALQAVHGAVHSAAIGTKYTWFGSGYISSMYYKWIANHPTFDFEGGGDLSFHRGKNVMMAARGDSEGKPRRQTGWRASCMMMWDTPEGGPCLLRPSGSRAADSPDPEHATTDCVEGFDEKWRPILAKTSGCAEATADERNVILGASYKGPQDECPGPYSSVDPNDAKALQNRHNTGWSNMFAFPWEICSYWNCTTSRQAGQHAIGCPGLEGDPVTEWPYRNTGSPIYASYAMNCSRNTYQGLADIVERFAGDQQYWSVKFLEAWDIMASNGAEGLTDGPEEGWLGYYSLDKQGRLQGETLSSLISNHKEDGLVWTDPEVDPYICGHRGHFKTSCGFTFSTCINKNIKGKGCEGNGDGPGIM